MLVCGIAGVVGEVEASDRDIVRLMCDAMRHRGPDGEGYFDGPGVCIGMRRLAILDVEHGQQPVFSEDRSIAAVFNGEVYNYRELQQALLSSGHDLSSLSDSECLPHLYEESGIRMFDRMRGMFAVALWDSVRHLLVIARDRVGKKPLFYAAVGGKLWFASEIKCLLAVPGISREIDPEGIHHYLTYRYVPHPWTAFRGIRKVAPGKVLTWESGKMVEESYWSLKYPEEQSGAPSEFNMDEVGAELRRHLLEATRIRLVSERPLGAFLSGG